MKGGLSKMPQSALARTIENPLVQDRVTFLETSDETGGAYEYVEVELAPGGGAGLHYHLAFTEHFEAVIGRHLRARRDVLEGDSRPAAERNLRFAVPDRQASRRGRATVEYVLQAIGG